VAIFNDRDRRFIAGCLDSQNSQTHFLAISRQFSAISYRAAAPADLLKSRLLNADC
jgi:hypothetical protein